VHFYHCEGNRSVEQLWTDRYIGWSFRQFSEFGKAGLNDSKQEETRNSFFKNVPKSCVPCNQVVAQVCCTKV